MYSTVVVDECFPVDESPSRSADVICWGPHNVLSVCTKWMVKLYLATLRQDAKQIIIRHHPLCHRHDKQSLEVVNSARWAPSLLHETYYPATARLCVATSANLVVYRVSRHGNHSVSVSYGVGIAVTNPNMWAMSREQQEGEERESEKNDKETSLEESTTLQGVHRKKNTRTLNTEDSEKSNKRQKTDSKVKKSQKRDIQKDKRIKKNTAQSSKTTLKRASQRNNVRQHPPQKNVKSIQRRQSRVDSDSDSNSSCSESISYDSEYSEEEESSSSSISSANRKSTHRSSARNDVSTITIIGYNTNERNRNNTDTENLNHLERYTLVDYYWLDYEQLLIITNVGVHVISLWNNFSDEESAQVLTLPREPHYTFANDTLGVSALYIACSSLLKVDNAHQSARCITYLLFCASPFVFRVLLVICNDPLQSTETCNPSTLDSHIGTCVGNTNTYRARSATVKVVGLHYVELHSMKGVPASMCCYLDDCNGHRQNTDLSCRNNNYNNYRFTDSEHVEEMSEVQSEKELMEEYFVVSVGAIISSPNETIRGSFAVHMHSSTIGMWTRERAVHEHSAKETTQKEYCTNNIYKLSASEWQPNACFDLSLLANETTLRSLHLVDLSHVHVPLTQELVESDMRSHALPLSSRYFVVGVTRHYIYGFTSRGLQPVLLFQCPSLASAFEMPLHSALAVSGMAIHSSCTLALLLLQNGQVNSVPMFVKSICVNDVSGLLGRMLTLCGVQLVHESNTKAGKDISQGYRTAEEKSKRLLTHTALVSEPSSSPPMEHNSLQLALWERQHSYSFFIWEQLFSSDAECVSLRLYSEEFTKLMHARRWNNCYMTNSKTTTTNTRTHTESDEVIGNLNKNALSCYSFIEKVLCQRYLMLREEFCVDLFLRHVMPSTEEAFTQSLHKIINDRSITRNENNYQYNDSSASADQKNLSNNVTHWQWWELLLAIWRRAPSNTWCLHEIILANALLVIAKYTHYASFDLESDETFERTNDKCSTNAQTLSYCGAVTFVQLYIAHQTELLSVYSHNINVEENKATLTSCSSLPFMNLHKTEKWVKHLKEWLQHYCAELLCAHERCYHNENNNNRINNSIDASSSSEYSLLGKHLFPCSLCEAKGVAKLTPIFSYNVVHSLHEQHTTLFSPKTFCALSMLSDEAVLTKCRDCGFRDYARHALCVICGGVLV